MKIPNFLKKMESKKVTATLAAISFIAGFFFMNKNITGNMIIENTELYIQTTSIIGLLLIICSVLLVYYTIKKE